MPTVRPDVVALCCSDLHLSVRPPVARAGEEDWLVAQDRQMGQLRELQQEYDCPVLIAGDIFDRWSSPAKLINWAISALPKRCIAIPGQHDLPNHRLEAIQDSAYWTLREAGKLFHLTPGKPYMIESNHKKSHPFWVQGFPWGTPLKRTKPDSLLQIALVHAYTSIKGREYPGAPKSCRVSNLKEIKGWDIVVFGDNHKGFMVDHGNSVIFNCGGFQRRKSDEISYLSQVGLIMSDGTLMPHLLDCSSDIITETFSVPTPEENMELKDFLEELTSLQDSSLDFEEAIKQALDHGRPRSLQVRQIITEALASS